MGISTEEQNPTPRGNVCPQIRWVTLPAGVTIDEVRAADGDASIVDAATVATAWGALVSTRGMRTIAQGTGVPLKATSPHTIVRALLRYVGEQTIGGEHRVKVVDASGRCYTVRVHTIAPERWATVQDITARYQRRTLHQHVPSIEIIDPRICTTGDLVPALPDDLLDDLFNEEIIEEESIFDEEIIEEEMSPSAFSVLLDQLLANAAAGVQGEDGVPQVPALTPHPPALTP